MKLYLVRHGEAKPRGEDPERPLTPKGEAEVKRVAQWVFKVGISVSEILHSGKLRAEQTASIFGNYLNPENGSIPVTGIAPNDDCLPVGKMLNKETEPLMMVGHLPFLSRLSSFLLLDNPNASFLQFKTASMVCLEKVEDQWTLAWVIHPDIVSV